MAEVGGERLQVLSLAGLPLQAIKGHGPLSGVCVDEDHCCATCLEGDHALVLWSVLPPAPSLGLIAANREDEQGLLTEAKGKASPMDAPSVATAAVPRRTSPKIPPTRPS